MRWYRGQPGAEDPECTAKKFTRRIEERSDRKAPVFIAKLFTKIKKQRASSGSKITQSSAGSSLRKQPSSSTGLFIGHRINPSMRHPEKHLGCFPRGVIPKVTTSPQTPRRLCPSHHAAARPRRMDGRTEGSGGSVKVLLCLGCWGAGARGRGRDRGASGARLPRASGIWCPAHAGVKQKPRASLGPDTTSVQVSPPGLHPKLRQRDKASSDSGAMDNGLLHRPWYWGGLLRPPSSSHVLLGRGGSAASSHSPRSRAGAKSRSPESGRGERDPAPRGPLSAAARPSAQPGGQATALPLHRGEAAGGGGV